MNVTSNSLDDGEGVQQQGRRFADALRDTEAGKGSGAPQHAADGGRRDGRFRETGRAEPPYAAQSRGSRRQGFLPLSRTTARRRSTPLGLRDGIRGSSPDGGACLAKHLISRDTSDLARKKVVESMLCLLEPQPLAIRIGVVVEARNQPFSEASTCFRRQLQNLGFESANGVSHQVNLITGRASVPRPTPRDSVLVFTS